MKWLKINDNLGSYVFPVVKIVFLLLLICLAFWGVRTCSINNSLLNFIVRFFAVLILITSVLCIYISIAEIIIVSDKKACQKNTSPVSCCVEYRIEDILIMAEKNDVMEIAIIYDGKKILVGSSSELDNGSSEFRDKLYFVAETEYKTISAFRRAIIPYSKDGLLIVYSIDGKVPKSV